MPLLVTITHHSFCLLLADQLETDLLTDFALLGTMGNVDMAWELTKQLHKKVNPSYDLKRCGEVFEKIIEPWRDDLLFLKEGPFEIVITGFYSNGRSGEITLRSGKDKLNEIIYPLRGTDEYLFTFIPPDRSLFRSTDLLLELPDDDPTTLENYMDHLISIVYPVIFTLYPDKVHQTGQFLALEKDIHRKKPQSHKRLVDISESLPFFPSKEELERMLLR